MYFGPGMGGNVFTPSSAGIGTHVITYEYTDNNGCSASSEVVIVVEDCTVGIEENQLNSLVLYPNPNAGRFTFSKVLDGALLEIYSVDGKCMHKGILSNEEQWIDISNSESGVYTLKMTHAGLERRFRVVLR